MYYYNKSYKARERYDPAKFVEYFEDGGYDVLTSYFIEELRKLPMNGERAVQVDEARPELLAYRIYGYVEFWWIIMEYNDHIHFESITSEQTITYPSLRDVEELFFRLHSTEIANRRDEAIAAAVGEAAWVRRDFIYSILTRFNIGNDSGVVWDTVETDFTLPGDFIDDSEMVFLNGQLLYRGASNDYTVSGVTVTFNVPPTTGDVVFYNYQGALTGINAYSKRSIFEFIEDTTEIELEEAPYNDGILLFKNGIMLVLNEDFTVVDTTITMILPFETGDYAVVHYLVELEEEVPRESEYIVQELPVLNRFKRTFRLSHSMVPGSEMIFNNGVMLTMGRDKDYQVARSGKAIVLNRFPDLDDLLCVTYQARVVG